MGKSRAKRMIGQHASETWFANGIGYRRCSTCGEVKRLYDDYHRNGTDDEGQAAYRLECKTCYNAKRKENKASSKHAEFVGHQRHRGEADINYTYTEWREAVIFFGGMCAYCGRSMRKGETLTMDHWQPFADGGKTQQDNVIPACTGCNCSKGKKDGKEWFMAQSFFSQERLNKIFQWRSIIRAAGGGDADE